MVQESKPAHPAMLLVDLSLAQISLRSNCATCRAQILDKYRCLTCVVVNKVYPASFTIRSKC
eukprot:13868-Heterococcus_DN1.PRE.5